MEERVPPSATAIAGDQTDEPPNQYGHSRRKLSSFDDSFDYSSAYGPVGSLLFTFEEENDTNTYVVQVPKDQIYRVPPPENAKIVERYLNNHSTKNKKSCCTRLCWIILILLVIGISIGITLVILHTVYSPKGAGFSIVDVHVKNKSRPGYEFTMKVKNPNENVGINFEKDGNAFLFFKTHKLGTGKFSELQLESSGSRNINITLRGSNSVPEDVSKSMQDKKNERAVSLKMKMNLKGNMDLWFLNIWSKDMDVVCDFKVSTLRTGTKVLSQKCDTEIK